MQCVDSVDWRHIDAQQFCMERERDRLSWCGLVNERRIGDVWWDDSE